MAAGSFCTLGTSKRAIQCFIRTSHYLQLIFNSSNECGTGSAGPAGEKRCLRDVSVHVAPSLPASLQAQGCFPPMCSLLSPHAPHSLTAKPHLGSLGAIRGRSAFRALQTMGSCRMEAMSTSCHCLIRGSRPCAVPPRAAGSQLKPQAGCGRSRCCGFGMKEGCAEAQWCAWG